MLYPHDKTLYKRNISPTEGKGRENMTITKEDFEEIKRRLDEAENDDTPYAIVANEEIGIVGDADKTEMKKGEYTIRFGFPNTEEWRKRINPDEIFKETENYIGVIKTFKDVFVSPRRHSIVLSAFTELYAFFNFIMDDGEVRDLTEEELPMALKVLDENADSVYRAVAAIIGIDEDVAEWMLETDATTALLKMIQDFPEIVNETDFF